MKKALFIFDRVAHYHRDLFQRLDRELCSCGWELHLLSGRARAGSIGRVGLSESVVTNELKYTFREHQIGNYVFRTSRGVLGAVRLIKPDVVVCPAHPGDFTHWLLLHDRDRVGYRLLAWQCGYEYNPGRFKQHLLRHFVPRFDHHLAYHSNARAYALSHGAPQELVTVMHNTINEARIHRMPQDEARVIIMGRHPELQGRRIALFVGAILAEKNIELILDALDVLKDPTLALVVVGDGPHMPQLRALAAGRQDVLFAGSIVDGVDLYFDASDMYVLPGTGGLGINEAMAHGLPIVSAYADGSADDLVVDGFNGFRLYDGTPGELAERLRLLLADPARRARMGQASQEMIRTTFSFDSFVGRVKNVLCAQ